jgi:hypothetical protein
MEPEARTAPNIRLNTATAAHLNGFMTVFYPPTLDAAFERNQQKTSALGLPASTIHHFIICTASA